MQRTPRGPFVIGRLAMGVALALALACGSAPKTPEPAPATDAPEAEPVTADTAPLPADAQPLPENAQPLPADADAAPARAKLTAKECETKGGSVVGDIGDGAIHRPDYKCPGGAPPLGDIGVTQGEPVAVEGAVCCPG